MKTPATPSDVIIAVSMALVMDKATDTSPWEDINLSKDNMELHVSTSASDEWVITARRRTIAEKKQDLKEILDSLN